MILRLYKTIWIKTGASCIFKRLNLPVILVLQDRELADDEIEGKYNLSVVLPSDMCMLLFNTQSFAIICYKIILLGPNIFLYNGINRVFVTNVPNLSIQNIHKWPKNAES